MKILGHINKEPEFEPIVSDVIVNKTDLLKLLEKYRKGNITAVENARLVDYYEAFENQPDILAVLSDAEQRALKEEILDAIWKRIDSSEKTGSQ